MTAKRDQRSSGCREREEETGGKGDKVLLSLLCWPNTTLVKARQGDLKSERNADREKVNTKRGLL